MKPLQARALRSGVNLLLGAEQALVFHRLGNGWTPRARRVLVHRPGNIGDTVVAVPALLAVRHLYPGASVTLLTSPGRPGLPSAAELLDGTGIVDDYVLYTPDGRLSGWRLAHRLRQGNFDLFVALSSAGGGGRAPALFRDMLFAKLAGCKAVGGFRLASLPQRWLPVVPAYSGSVLPEFERLLSLVPGGRRWWRPNQFAWPGLKQLKERGSALLRSHGVAAGERFAVIHPGAKLPLKRWMPDRFGLLAQHMARAWDAKVILTGGPQERVISNQVLRASGDGVCLDLTGKTTVRELMGIIAVAEAVVSNDTGAIHLAAALDTPCLVLMSGRDHPSKWRPIRNNHLRLQADVPCSPCRRNECASRECLRNITVNEAAAAFDELWRRRPNQREERARNT